MNIPLKQTLYYRALLLQTFKIIVQYIYIYIYTTVLKKVAFLKTYIIYIIIPFLCLYLFLSTPLKTHMYIGKKNCNGHNGITLLKEARKGFLVAIVFVKR